MKKLTALLLILCLLAPGIPALAEEAESASREDAARVAVNLQAIKVMLDDNDLEFTYQKESDSFMVPYELDCPMQYATIWLTSYEDGVWVQADYDAEIPEDKWEEMQRFCALCTESMRLGCFYLDREHKSLGYQFFIYTDVVAPTQHALVYATSMALVMLEYRGAGAAALLNGDATVEQALEMISDLE